MAPGFDERGVIVSRILRPGNPPAGVGSESVRF